MTKNIKNFKLSCHKVYKILSYVATAFSEKSDKHRL